MTSDKTLTEIREVPFAGIIANLAASCRSTTCPTGVILAEDHMVPMWQFDWNGFGLGETQWLDRTGLNQPCRTDHLPP